MLRRALLMALAIWFEAGVRERRLFFFVNALVVGLIRFLNALGVELIKFALKHVSLVVGLGSSCRGAADWITSDALRHQTHPCQTRNICTSRQGNASYSCVQADGETVLNPSWRQERRVPRMSPPSYQGPPLSKRRARQFIAKCRQSER